MVFFLLVGLWCVCVCVCVDCHSFFVVVVGFVFFKYSWVGSAGKSCVMRKKSAVCVPIFKAQRADKERVSYRVVACVFCVLFFLLLCKMKMWGNEKSACVCVCDFFWYVSLSLSGAKSLNDGEKETAFFFFFFHSGNGIFFSSLQKVMCVRVRFFGMFSLSFCLSLMVRRV